MSIALVTTVKAVSVGVGFEKTLKYLCHQSSVELTIKYQDEKMN